MLAGQVSVPHRESQPQVVSAAEIVASLTANGAVVTRDTDGKVWISTMFYNAPNGPKQPKDWEKTEATRAYILTTANKLQVSFENMVDKNGASPYGGRNGWWIRPPELLWHAHRFANNPFKPGIEKGVRDRVAIHEDGETEVTVGRCPWPH